MGWGPGSSVSVHRLTGYSLRARRHSRPTHRPSVNEDIERTSERDALPMTTTMTTIRFYPASHPSPKNERAHSHLGLAPHTFSLHQHPSRGRLRGGVTAFYTTDRVMCASFRKFGDFLPGTGTQDDGAGKGKGYSR
ncbi:hypothetical protein C8F01DRAFT_635214 [Mycena amicta]|nr:hypothetical protein C8F01DRAFT_635214 [Mycena amicta]